MEKRDNVDLVKFLAMVGVSLVGAVLLFLVGGGLAQVSNNSGTLLGFSFNASGGIAGFVIIYVLSDRTLDRWRKAADEVEAEKRKAQQEILKAATDLRLKLRGKPRFSPADSYEGQCVIRRAGGPKEIVPIDDNQWEHELLVVELRDIHVNDWISAEIRNRAGEKWTVSDFSLHQPEVVAVRLRTTTMTAVAQTTTNDRPNNGFRVESTARELKREVADFTPTVRKPDDAVFSAMPEPVGANNSSGSIAIVPNQKPNTRS